MLLLLHLNTAFGLNHFNFYVHEPSLMFIIFKGSVKIPAMDLVDLRWMQKEVNNIILNRDQAPFTM